MRSRWAIIGWCLCNRRTSSRLRLLLTRLSISRAKKREFRRLFITRLTAAAEMRGLRYSRLIHGLRLANIGLDRKSLSELVQVVASFLAEAGLFPAALKHLELEEQLAPGSTRKGGSPLRAINAVAPETSPTPPPPICSTKIEVAATRTHSGASALT